ncbi:MAG: DUF4412 domain-containing protein [Prosthecobacter sp.]
MKHFACSLLALLCTATFASADWVLVQKTMSDGQEKTITSKIKGGKARLDMGADASVILDEAGMTMMMHAQKVMMKADAAALKSMVDAAAKMGGQTDAPKPKPVATGQKEKVGDWDTEIFTWEGPMGKGRYWVTKSIPKYAEINAATDKLKAMGGAMSAVAPEASDFDGMVVKLEAVVMGKNVSTTLESVKEQDVEDKEFIPAEGYTEMKRPAPPQ